MYKNANRGNFTPLHKYRAVIIELLEAIKRYTEAEKCQNFYPKENSLIPGRI